MLPDQGCAPEGSCHNGLQLHPCQYLSGPHCKHTGNYRSHSECLLRQNPQMIIALRTVQMLSS